MDILFLLLVFLLAGMVKGVLGLGLPTVAMGLLGAVMPPAQAAALLVLPSLVTISGSFSPARASGRCCGGCGA
ncbi:hypothetical protein [Teichococcus aestuarii]|uniref:hypothetical protein n=1 Tax=Teichococcus aestuarii TaxID=568898 RepID=UPI0036079BEA